MLLTFKPDMARHLAGNERRSTTSTAIAWATAQARMTAHATLDVVARSGPGEMATLR